MDLNLTGNHAYVGGSSKGIGKAAAIELAALGAHVTLVSRSGEIMAEIIHKLDRSKGQAHDFMVADFSNRPHLISQVNALVSSRPVHILVNNTGGPPGGPITEAEPGAFEEAFHNHLLCNHQLARAVMPEMIKAGFGRIINVISTSVKQPLPGLGVSNTIRAAVASWAKTMANELGQYGITVNNVLPGATSTDRLRSILESVAKKRGISIEQASLNMQAEIPVGRFASPAEVGAAIAFLASPAAASINGINLPVDGGRTKSL